METMIYEYHISVTVIIKTKYQLLIILQQMNLSWILNSAYQPLAFKNMLLQPAEERGKRSQMRLRLYPLSLN